MSRNRVQWRDSGVKYPHEVRERRTLGCPSPSGPKGPKSRLPPWYLSGQTPCSEPYHRYLARGFQKRPETGRSTSFRAQVPPEVLPSPSSGTAARYRHAEPRACLTRLAWLRISAGLYEIVCTPG